MFKNNVKSKFYTKITYQKPNKNYIQLSDNLVENRYAIKTFHKNLKKSKSIEIFK